MVQMSMVNPSHGKYDHGKSESCEAYHVSCGTNELAPIYSPNFGMIDKKHFKLYQKTK